MLAYIAWMSAPVLTFLFFVVFFARPGARRRRREGNAARKLGDEAMEALGAVKDGRCYALERGGVRWQARLCSGGDGVYLYQIFGALPPPTAPDAAPHPPRVRLLREASADRLLKWLTPGLDLETGDPEFDRRLLILAHDEDTEHARAWLSDAETRRAILELFSQTCESISIDDELKTGSRYNGPARVALRASFSPDPAWRDPARLASVLDHLRAVHAAAPAAAASPPAPSTFRVYAGLAAGVLVSFVILSICSTVYPTISQFAFGGLALLSLLSGWLWIAGSAILSTRRGRIDISTLLIRLVGSWYIGWPLILSALLTVNAVSDDTLRDHPTSIVEVYETRSDSGTVWRARLSAVPGLAESLTVSLSEAEAALARPGDPCVFRGGEGGLGEPWRQSVRCTIDGEPRRL